MGSLEPSTDSTGMAKAEQSNASFANNVNAWKDVLAKHEELLERATWEGRPAHVSRHIGRGQVLARDRVALLLDEGSPFLELCPFAGHGLQDSTPSASLVGGIGIVSGVICMILAHIPTINGGAWNEYTVLKQNRITKIATQNGLPIIALVQSAGVFLPQQFRVFHKGGQIFRDLAIRTKKSQASCAIVFGSSTAGGAYHPALSDYTIFVKDQAQVCLGGPPLVKMATGEVVGAEELGGAEMHATVSGLCDQLAQDEFDAIRKARDWVAATQLLRAPENVRESLAPRYPSDDILGLVNTDIRRPLPMMEVLLRIVDDSRLDLFKPMFGKGMITAWCRVHGHAVGVVANQQPVIFPQEAEKAAHFIQLCNQNNTPIIFFHNVTGFMVGLKSERDALIRKGARLVSTVSTSAVPHISIICGASYGAGNYAMCGRAYKPRFLFTWPIGRCAVMGPDQLGGVMDLISQKSKSPEEETVNKPTAAGQSLRDDVKRDSESYNTSAHLLDDGVIDPRDTRNVLGMCLEVVSLPSNSSNHQFRVLARM